MHFRVNGCRHSERTAGHFASPELQHHHDTCDPYRNLHSTVQHLPDLSIPTVVLGVTEFFWAIAALLA
jgi:hypothetical protein